MDKETGKYKCPEEPSENYSCEKKCQKSYVKESYTNDHYYGKDIKRYKNNNDGVIADLILNGPVVAAFSVYEDFYNVSFFKNSSDSVNCSFLC